MTEMMLCELKIDHVDAEWRQFNSSGAESGDLSVQVHLLSRGPLISPESVPKGGFGG